MDKLPRGFQVYILAVIAVAAGVVWLGAATISWERWPEMLMFTVLITLASMYPIPNPRGGFLTSTGTLFYVLFCVHNPITTLLVAGCGFGLGQAISRGWVPWRVLFNGAQMGLSVGIAGVVFRLSGGSLEHASVLSLLGPLGLASLSQQICNNLLISWFVGLLRRTSFLRWWFVEIRDYLWANVLTIPTAALLAVVFVSIHPLTLLVYLVSLPAQRWAIELYLQHRRIFGQAINSLVVAVDASFPQGRGHSRRVADLAVAIARQLDLSDSVVDGIELGALVHDVGMIGLEELLESNDAADRGQILQHVTIGAEVAREIPRRDIGDVVLFHHEHFDGTGYLGFKGSQIPIGARIVALVEAVESMPRVHGVGSDTMLDESIIRKIRDGAGKQFDPRVVSAFLEVTKDNPELLRLSSDPPSSELTVEPELGG
jgi:HD-GYP domain-containing protein (c-di-GMP phosphodiesterase class II)